LTGVILAGGSSGRMSRPKHLLVLGGQTLLERAASRLEPFVSRVVIAGGAEAAAIRAAHKETVDDIFAGGGPLAGIHAALAATGDTCAVVGCDMPFFSPELLARMEREMGDALVAVPQVGPYFEPLHAVFRPECARHICALFNDGARAGMAPRPGRQGYPRVTDLFSRVKVQVSGEDVVRQFGDPHTIFFNINDPGDYEAALRAVEHRAR